MHLYPVILVVFLQFVVLSFVSISHGGQWSLNKLLTFINQEQQL